MHSESYLAALCRAVPYHIVEAVLENPSEAAFGYRDVEGSVLYADLVSFTAMCERIARGGQERLGRLSRVLDELFTGLELEAFFPFQGYITEFAGDAMMVVFTGPGHAQRCAAAALTCQEVVRRVSEGALGEDSRDLRLRVGAASGRVHLSVIGDLARRFSVCSGEPTHRAIAIEQRAAPGNVLIDGATAEQLGSDARLHPEADGLWRLEALEVWPQRRALAPLGRRIQDRVPEKIALLEPFVPSPLARRLRTLPGGWRIEAEIRSPVILFVEFEGHSENPTDFSTSVSLSRSVLRAFQKYDGLVLKVTATERGHRAMVLFGLHHPTEHDAEKAILAALEAATRVRGYTGQPTGLSARFGIHTGPVFFGAIGGEHKHDLTAIGDAVNATARATAVAEPFEIIVTDAVVAAAPGAFSVSARGPIKVKGREEPLALHLVHGPSEGRAHFAQRRSQQRFTVGRDAQLLELRKAVDEAWNGRGTLLGLKGETGTGKSHLLSNLIDQWVERGGRAIITRCRYSTRVTPLAPIRELFATLVGSTSADDEVTRATRLSHYLHGLNLGMDVPELISILQPVRRPDGFDETLVDLADPHARDRLVAALIRIVDQRVRSSDRLMYVLEDVHHADSLTLQLAQKLASLPRENALFVVGTWRPEPVLEDLERAMDRVVVVGNLDLAASTELIRCEMRAGGVDPYLAEFLWKRADGNPEHLVQTVRFLADRLLLSLRGDTVISPPQWRDRLEELVPPRWEHVALARLDGLNEIERRVLRTASAIGSQFGQEILEEATEAELDREMVSDAIAALEAHRIFAPDTMRAHGWRFRDDATRAIAYSVIPPEERALVHRRIADALEKVPKGRPEQVAAAIAHHRERAGQTREALRWYGVVARGAFRAGLETEAQHFAEKWEDLHAHLSGDDPAIERHAPWIAVIRMYVTGARGRPREALELGRELLRRYRNRMEPAALEIARFTIARSRDALGMLARARSGLRRVHDSEVETIAFESRLALGQIAEWTRDLGEGWKWLTAAEERAGDNPYRHVRLELLRGWLELAQIRTERACASFSEAHQASSQSDHARLRAAAANGSGTCALLERRFDDAHRELDEALRISQSFGNIREEASALIRKGATLLWQGRYDDALSPLERAAALVDEGGHERLEAELKVVHGVAVAATRDVREGRELCEAGLAIAARQGLWVPELFGRLAAFEIARISRDPAEESRTREAIPEEFIRGFPLIGVALQ